MNEAVEWLEESVDTWALYMGNGALHNDAGPMYTIKDIGMVCNCSDSKHDNAGKMSFRSAGVLPYRYGVGTGTYNIPLIWDHWRRPCP